MTLLFVVIGGAVGAPLRYLTDLFVQSKHDTAFPWGTLTVNVVGSAVARWGPGRGVGRTPVPGSRRAVGDRVVRRADDLLDVRVRDRPPDAGGVAVAAGLNVTVSLAAGFLAGAGAWALTLALLGG